MLAFAGGPGSAAEESGELLFGVGRIPSAMLEETEIADLRR